MENNAIQNCIPLFQFQLLNTFEHRMITGAGSARLLSDA